MSMNQFLEIIIGLPIIVGLIIFVGPLVGRLIGLLGLPKEALDMIGLAIVMIGGLTSALVYGGA